MIRWRPWVGPPDRLRNPPRGWRAGGPLLPSAIPLPSRLRPALECPAGPGAPQGRSPLRGPTPGGQTGRDPAARVQAGVLTRSTRSAAAAIVAPLPVSENRAAVRDRGELYRRHRSVHATTGGRRQQQFLGSGPTVWASWSMGHRCRVVRRRPRRSHAALAQKLRSVPG